MWLALVKRFFVPFWEVGNQIALLRKVLGLEDGVIALVSGVIKCGEDILAFQKWVIFSDLVERRSGSEQLQSVGDAQSQAANTGATAAFAGVNGDALKMFAVHRGRCVEDTPYSGLGARV